MNASIPSDDLQGTRTGLPEPIAQLLMAPFQARTYGNLVYLLLSFPLGIFHFVFLATGLSLALGMMITILGLPALGLTLWASWWLAAMERQLAIHLLGARVPPTGPGFGGSGEGFVADLRQFLSNPVTWTGLIFLLLKFPLGVLSFVVLVTLVAASMSFLLVPFLYPFSFIEWDGLMLWWVDSPAEAALCLLAGVLLTWVSLVILNGLALMWRGLSVAFLGNERFLEPAVAPPAPPTPALPEAAEAPLA